ncbi:cold shock domain-containing protein [Francisella tularensis subsp. novicida]|uniref:cold-shock protein n=1 Tax=Francisella tularensis TaxID=263 RepID=UPI0008FD04A0|nr:CFI-box-CTERM domain-containing protein [Francisella tularensis]APC95235.1 'Cold-shock' DNA-binding domain protein [Francisella tularensis subsp. novicida]MBK2346727.1 cold shock domain-containing protein [Francisella tularensis subsp. novicida]
MSDSRYTGTIKFYNSEKGYGFIFDNESEKDLFFNIGSWKNPSVPSAGDDVEFDIIQAKKGDKATNVKLIKSKQDKKQESFNKKDERETCPHCNKKIVPRMSFYNGKPNKSYCPFCGGLVKNFSACFIATSVYGDYEHPQVIVLRKFRDNYLLPNKIGKIFVKYYYKYSPRVAEYLNKKKFLSLVVRKILDGFIFVFNKFTSK